MTLEQIAEFARLDPSGYRKLERDAEVYLKSLVANDGGEKNTAVRVLVYGLIANRERHRMKVLLGLERAKARGTPLGRRRNPVERQLPSCEGLTHGVAAQKLGVSKATVKRWRRKARESK